MELDDLKLSWAGHDAKLEKGLTLNMHTLDLIQTQKIKSTLRGLLWQRRIELGFHSISIMLLLAFLYFNLGQLPYALSGLALLAFYVLLFVNCLQQLTTIHSIHHNQDVLTIQASLKKIQSHMLNFIRLSVLCIPSLLCFAVVVPEAFKDLGINFFNGFDIIRHTNGSWWTVQIIVLIVMIPLGIWFYHQVNYSNIHKKWVRKVIDNTAGNKLGEAMEFLNEVERLRK